MDVDPFSLELSRPLETASGIVEQRRGFVVSVEYEGTEGFGEATPFSGWTESVEDCEAALADADVVGEQLDWGIALARMDAPAARHGLSLALADASAQSEAVPLYRYLGADHTVRSIPVNATIGDGSPTATAEEARDAVAAGFTAVKVKVGARSLAADRERLVAVRDAIGERARVRVDANAAWDRETATEAIDVLAALGVEYVEQPLPPDDLAGLADLRDGDVGVAVDETLVEHDLDAVIAADAADVVVIKPMVQGGPDRAAALASSARAAGVEPVVSTTIDGVVARTAAVHVAATIPEVAPCGLATADLLATDLGTDPAPVEDGAVYVPQDKGLGLAEQPRT
ncbi:o-succinylbenzoate synthase [Halobacteriales archaeon Cl-PHB]